MTYYPVQSPYPIFNDEDGTPLEDGYIYIGEANQNPITNPITVSWDLAGLYPAAQPIRTIGGYPDRNGSPGKLFINFADQAFYSILVQDKHEQNVYFEKNEELIITNTNDYALNVKWLGATGDGVTDDSAAITAAYTYGRSVYFPAGTYVINANTTISKKTILDSGASFAISNAVTLTVNALIDAPITEIFSGSGNVDGDFASSFVHYEWFDSTIVNTGDFLPRVYQSNESVSLTVGTDTTTVQEALDQIPLLLNHNFVVIIPAGSTYDSEELLVPEYYAATLNTQLADPRADAGNFVIRSDDLTTPGYAQIGSIMYSGGNGRSTMYYLHTTNEHSQSDFAAIEIRGDIKLTINGAKGDSSNKGSAVNRWLSTYEGGFIEVKGPIDLGTNEFVNAFCAKRGGYINAHCYDSDAGDVNITGTVDYVMWPQGGTVLYSRGASAAGSVLTYNEAISKSGEGSAISWDRSNPVIDSHREEAAEKEFWFSWSHYQAATIAIAATTAHLITKLSIEIPPYMVCVLDRVQSLFGDANFRIRIERIGGLSDYDMPDDDLFYYEHRPSLIVADNSASNSRLTATLWIDVYNTDVSSGNIVQGDNFQLKFLYTSKNLKEQTI